MGRTFFYKGLRVNAFGIPVSGETKSIKDRSKRKKDFYFISFKPEKGENAPKDLIVMYDIPEEKKKERDWFRRQLKNFHYLMIHKSVWVGPSPLPQEFKRYVKFVGLQDKVITFKLAKPYDKKKFDL